MSEFISQIDPCLKDHCAQAVSCDSVEKIISSRNKDLGGFEVRRLLPVSGHRKIGPWVFFDHMGPADFKSGHGINVRPHPHINLATVTYTFEGEIWHRDSLGNSCPIKPGELNLMVAGKGIVHSERTSPELLKSGQKLNGLQLWMALPERFEETEPEFLHYSKEELPVVHQNGVAIKVLIGEAFAVKSPVKQFASTLYVEARLKKGQSLQVPKAQERAIYVASGALKIAKQSIDRFNLVVLKENRDVIVEALEDTFIAIIGGEKLTARFMEWNFVSSRKGRIEEAKNDWSQGHFPKVFEDEEEFIPYP